MKKIVREKMNKEDKYSNRMSLSKPKEAAKKQEAELS